MSRTDLLALSPLIVLAITIVMAMLVAAFYRRHAVVMWVSQIGLLLSFTSLVIALPHAGAEVTSLLIVDGYSLFFSALMLAAAVAINMLAYDYLRRRSPVPEEFYVLLLVATLGALVLVMSRHFAAFFIGIELLSVSLFALIAYTNRQWRPLEAGIKYLILGGVASAFLLLGMALIYSELGTLEFNRLSSMSATVRLPYLLAGAALLLTGVGFKLSLVPFHMWVADIYEGAPAPVGAFLATISKGAVFVLLLRYLPQTDFNSDSSLLWALSLVAIASMVAGNLLALLQNNIKRLLAYSSVAHLGYLLVIVIAGGTLAAEAAAFYLTAYFVTMLGAFGIITLLSNGERDAELMSDYEGLFWQRPWLAIVMALMLLSLAGIPLTMGFVAKFYILAAGVMQAQWLLVFSLIIASAIGLYYYLRFTITLFRVSDEAVQPTDNSYSLGAGVVVTAVTLLLLIFGIYPTPLIDLLHLHALVPHW